MQKQLLHWTERKTQFFVFVIIGLYLMLFLPFWEPVLLGFLFASACEPLINAIRTRVHARRSRVAYATVGVWIAFTIGLVSIIVLQGYSQIYDLFQNGDSMAQFNDKVAHFRDQFLAWANNQSYLSSFNIKSQLDRAVVGFTNTSKVVILAGAQSFLARAPHTLINLFIFIAAFGAFLGIQPRIWETIEQALRLGGRSREHFQRFEKICALALGSLLITGFVQSILVTIGAAIAGFDAYFIIFAVTFLFAMIPLLGAGAIPVILTIFSLLEGKYSSAIILAITAAIVGVADNILRAWLFSRAAKSNPVISIISLLGGIALLGFAGLFVAPVLEQLAMTYAFSDEGEPEPHEVTPAKEPTPPDRLVRPTHKEFVPQA